MITRRRTWIAAAATLIVLSTVGGGVSGGPTATAAPVASATIPVFVQGGQGTQNAVCIPSKPTCPVAGGIAAAMARGFSGILGIGMKHGASGLASPILGMPAPLAQSWSLHTLQLSQARWTGVPVYSGTTIVKAGTPVAVGFLGAPSAFWKFSAGLTKSADLVTLRPEVNPFVNTGVQAYYTFTILYDDVNGVIGLATA